MKKFIYLLFTATLFLATACDKEDEMTTSSSNNHDILRCKINGEDWTPAGGDLFTSKYDLLYYSDTKGLDLIARNTTSNNILNGAISIDCKVKDIDIENPLRFWENVLLNRNYIDSCHYFHLDTLKKNYIKVKEIDSLEYFIIGEFQFSTINECNDSIQITDGYFDLNYKF